MKYSIFPFIAGLLFAPQLALAQDGPQLQINGSLKFGWQKSEVAMPDLDPVPAIGKGLKVEANLNGLVYGSFDGGLSYGLQFWLPVVGGWTASTTGTSNAVRRDVGVAAYFAGQGWQFSIGHMDDAYRAALGNVDVGETVGDLPANALLDLGANEGFLRYSGGPSLRFDATYSDFTIYSSISDEELTMPRGDFGPVDLGRPVVAVGLRWETETALGKLFVAAAAQSPDFSSADAGFHGVSAGIEVGALSFKISRSEGPISNYNNVIENRASYRGASVEYNDGGWTIGANYGQQVSTNSSSLVNGSGRAVWVSKQLPDDFSISASWSRTHFNDSDENVPIDTDLMSIGFIKTF